LFRETADFERFSADYERYMDVVARTLAWCLMGNHFHFIITILKEEDILPFSELPPGNRLKSSPTPSVVENPDGGKITSLRFLPLSGSSTTDRVGTIPFNLRKPKPSTQLSHLFNSYAQYYNKKYQRKGVLFEKGFRRKIVDDPEYLKNLMDYIHNNPVKHGFADHPGDYPWSSYTTSRLIQPKP